MPALLAGGALLAAYVLVFGLATVACAIGMAHVSKIQEPDTRRGLFWLLGTSGAWAGTTALFLIVPGDDLKIAIYIVGLIVGLATIGPWLYFCSAYTGRALHRDADLRWIAIVVFAAIVAIKVTNPWHGYYFAVQKSFVGFPHLDVRYGTIHWIVMGLSYTLAAIGYFMLFEMFTRVGHERGSLAVLVGVTGLPIVLDIAALVVPGLIEINYEPLGVAAFGIGVLFLYLGDFRTVRLAAEDDDPIVVLDETQCVRDFNIAAKDAFPELEGAYGDPVAEVVPALAEELSEEQSIIEIHRIGGLHYYGVTRSPFMGDSSEAGTLLTLSDVTERERYRRELERQNERLEQFASMVSHDLRNPLTVAKGNLELAADSDDAEHLETVATALDRMETLIEDMLALARQGQPIDETEPVSLSAVVEQSWSVIASESATLSIEDDLAFEADPDRLQQLFENLFRNAVEHGGSDVTIRVGGLEGDAGFYVEDDGPGIPAADRESVFESGYTSDPDGTGFGLAIVREIVDAHGWSIRAVEGERGGAGFEITGIEALE